MRGQTQIYHQPQSATRYTVTQICLLVDSGVIASKSFHERRQMRQVLKNNIEAQKGYAQRTEMPAKLGHWEVAKKLEKYRKAIADR
jgi:hypothetical protein